MKFLLVSNGDLAKEMYRSMRGFYSDPELDVLCLQTNRDSFMNDLHVYFSNTNEEILVACDAFGSTAFNEVAYLVMKQGIGQRVGIISGMNLPMIFKLYGLKDQWNIQNIMSIYSNEKNVWDDSAFYYAPAV